MVAWWGSAIECASAIARLERDGVFDAEALRSNGDLFTQLSASWFDIKPSPSLRDQALRLLRVHPLRAADAMQLAAAIEWAGAGVRGMFASYCDRLLAAAEPDGFAVA